MMTTGAGHAKKKVTELAASTREYQHSPSYDQDVDNIGLFFEELKQHHIEQALQQCQDRNGPLAKAMIEMIENPSPPLSPLMMMTIPLTSLKREKNIRLIIANLAIR